MGNENSKHSSEDSTSMKTPAEIQACFRNIQTFEKIIFDLKKDNISTSVNTIMSLHDFSYPHTFNILLSQLIYSSYISRKDVSFEVYFQFIYEITQREEAIQNYCRLIDVFTQFIINVNTTESYPIINMLIEQNYLTPKTFTKRSLYFAHYLGDNFSMFIKESNLPYCVYMNQHLKEISNNDWELHKKYIKKGCNQSKITKIIRKDKVEKLQEIASIENFDPKQKIIPSLYEYHSFVNKENVTLIDYAAFFGSVKCFKFLLSYDIPIYSAFVFALAGGSDEIIHMCEQYNASFEGTLEIIIQFHRNALFHYLFDNKLVRFNNLENLGKKCVMFNNYEIFTLLLQNGMKINDDIINEFAKNGNLYIIKDLIPS